MFNNYFKIGIRNILKYKMFSFINIFGLAIAMSVCMLMLLMLTDQMAYDRFHSNKERIYRIVSTPLSTAQLRATIPFPVADKLKREFPCIEDAVFLRRGFGGDAMYNDHFSEIKGYFTTSSFFNIFSYKLEAGDARTALEKPNSLVISHHIALKLFGHDDPVGKILKYSDRGLNGWTAESKAPVDWGVYTVTGVFAEDKSKSHLEFDAMVSASTLDHLYSEGKIENLTNDWSNDYLSYAYVLLKKSSGAKELSGALKQVSELQLKGSDNEGLRNSRLTYQALTSINPGPAVGNAPTTTLPLFVYYILGGLSLVIMLAACLNYASISLARAATRSSEMGVRKVTGARRRDLIIQFLSETSITVILALVVANGILLLLKNAFLHLWLNKYLNFDLHFNGMTYVLFFGFSIVICFFAGIYPAFRLSGFSPVKALKKAAIAGSGGIGLRRVLTVSQFVISLLFIISSMVIYNQFRFYMNFDYGFNPHQVINVNLQSNNFDLVKNALSSVKGVTGVSGCAYLPATGRNDNLTLKIPGTEKTIQAIDLAVDENFIHVMEINLVAGNKLPLNVNDQSPFILVNEETAKALGSTLPREIIGQPFEMNGKQVQVAGVFKDFTFFLLFGGRTTGPIVMHPGTGNIKFANVKISAENPRAVLDDLNSKWKSIDPIHPIQYEFYDQALSNNNQGLLDIVSIIGFMAFLSITIACLGLLGMAIYTTERRTKEVGVRKMLGAGELQLNYLLSREFIVMIGIAILIAAPLSYFLNNLWLNFMVVRTEIGLGTLCFGSVILLVLGLTIVMTQTFIIAKRNPIVALKIE